MLKLAVFQLFCEEGREGEADEHGNVAEQISLGDSKTMELALQKKVTTLPGVTVWLNDFGLDLEQLSMFRGMTNTKHSSEPMLCTPRMC